MKPSAILFFLAVFSAFLTTKGLVAQSFVVQKVLDLPELEDAEFYKVFQDQKGFVWVASDRGVTRFDGQQSTVFSTRNGMAEDVTFFIDEDSQGRVYFLGLTGDLSIYEDGEMYIRKEEKDDLWRSPIINFLSDLKVDSTDKVWLGNDTALYHFRLGEPGQIDSFQISVDEINILPIRANYCLLHRKRSTEFRVDKRKGVRVGRKHWFPLAFKPCVGREHLEVKPGSKSGIWLSSNHQLFRLDTLTGQSKAYELPFKIKSMLWDNSGNLWLGAVDSGLYMYPQGDLASEPMRFFNNNTITDLIQDKEGGIWLTTLHVGIHHIYSSSTKAIELPKKESGNHFVKCVNGNSRGIFIGTNEGELFLYDPINSNTVLLNTAGMFRTVDNIEVNPSQKMEAFGLAYDIFEKQLPEIDLFSGIGHCWRGGNRIDFSRYQIKLPTGDTSQFWYNHRIECVRNEGESLLIGTLDRLFIYAHGQLTDYGEKYPRLRNRIRDIRKWPGGGWLIASHNHGLLWLKNEKLLSIYQAQEDHAFFRHIFVDKQQNIWVSGSVGIACISNLDKGLDQLQVSRYSKLEGLPTNNVNQCFVQDSLVYAATRVGCFVLNKNQLQSGPNRIKVYLRSSMIGPHDTLLPKGALIPPEFRDLTFDFQAIWQKNQERVQYQYRLLGQDSNWVASSGKSVRFSALPPGNYAFEVRARFGDDEWGHGDELATFELQPRFAETGWFLLLLLLGIGSFFALVAAVVVRAIRLKSRLENDANRFQHQALMAQLKPHFLYNSLNTIQFYLLSGDEQSCTDYLSRFSGLLRQVLQHSNHTLIGLDEEHMALQRYLELESMRFDHRFSFQLNLPKGIRPEDYLVPPLLIQPFVENALWHGILPKRSGTVEISWFLEQDVLLCVIEDDGIGRKAAQIQKAGSTNVIKESFGVSLGQKRLQLMQTIYRKSTSIRIHDKFTKQGEANGTRVELLLPLIKNNKHDNKQTAQRYR